jgi:hypothetical protein
VATTRPAGSQQAELGLLLAGAVQAVVEAQDALDEHARERAVAFAAEGPGSLALPPLWFAFETVSIDLELSSEVVRTPPPAGIGPRATQLLCRTLNPVTAGLFGYAAATGTRVRVALSPQRLVPATLPALDDPATRHEP